uniref:Uncharacterized protein n=1 Tax=Anguilla anguilla TaxID=7936 RepID=A0A0E9WV44_ANGAN
MGKYFCTFSKSESIFSYNHKSEHIPKDKSLLQDCTIPTAVSI